MYSLFLWIRNQLNCWRISYCIDLQKYPAPIKCFIFLKEGREVWLFQHYFHFLVSLGKYTERERKKNLVKFLSSKWKKREYTQAICCMAFLRGIFWDSYPRSTYYPEVTKEVLSVEHLNCSQTIIWLGSLTPALIYAGCVFYCFYSAAGFKDIIVFFGKRNEQNQIGLETVYCLKWTAVASAAIEVIP